MKNTEKKTSAKQIRSNALSPLPGSSISCRRALSIIVAMVVSMLLFTGCESQPERKKVDLTKKESPQAVNRLKTEKIKQEWVFGFDQRRSLEEDTRQYASFLRYLEDATGLEFKLRFTQKTGRIEDDLGRGIIHFAAFGAGAYIPAHEKYKVIPLARGLNKFGKPEYQSVIVTAPDSPLQSIEDLRGKRFAFGNYTSTQGHVIPRIILAEHGLTLDDFSHFDYTGGHHNCAMEVIAGNFDAGGMQDTLGREMAESGRLRILHTSEYYPSSCLAANKDVPPEVLDTMRKALLELDPKARHADILVDWDRTEMPNGFVAVKDEDFEKLRYWSTKLNLYDESQRPIKSR